MLQNYFKIAFRNLAKHKLFSFINIFGLSLGMCIGLIVILHLQEDLSYDHFHPAADRTFRVYSDITNQKGQAYSLASTPLPLGATLKANNDFIDNSVTLYPVGGKKATDGKKTLSVNLTFTDPSFFSVFGFKLEQGNATNVLTMPNSIVLSKAMATRFFGDQDPIGHSLVFDEMGSFLVTGVLTDNKQRSHIDFDGYASMSSVAVLEKNGKLEANAGNWAVFTSGYTYVALTKNGTEKQLNAALSKITATYKTAGIEDKSKVIFETQNITSITPGKELNNSIGRGPTIGKVAAEVAVALIILISACFNYTNLSIARSLKRSKEVGIRKVSGALRKHIFLQFIIEAIVFSLLAMCCAYCLTLLLAPLDLELLPATPELTPSLGLYFLVFSIFAGLLAGIIPAVTLSAFKPVQVLKSLATVKLFGRGGLRKALIVFQFSLSLVIIIFMLVFHKQFRYNATGDYGFNRERIINIELNGMDYHLLKDAFASISGVEKVSATSDNLGKFASGSVKVKQQSVDEPTEMRFFDVDENFVPNMQLQLIAGNNLSASSAAEEKQVLINQKALTALHINVPSEVVGKTIVLDDSTNVQVAGVIKDFHAEGFEFAIVPLILRSREKNFNYLNIKTGMDKADATILITQLANTWKKLYPHDAFSYTWYAQQFYDNKAAAGTVSMLGLLAFMGITIACLGLLGMVVYTAEGRVREVSIRKVLGASVAGLMQLLSKSFLKLVVIAVLIAAPIGFICSYFFLQIFVERVTIGLDIFAVACGSILVIALLVIGSQVYRVAVSNPANNLRAE